MCNGIRPLVRGPVMMVTALTMSILLNAQLALIFAVAIPLLAAALFLILRKLRPAYGPDAAGAGQGATPWRRRT